MTDSEIVTDAPTTMTTRRPLFSSHLKSRPKVKPRVRERIEPGIRRRLPGGFYEAWVEVKGKRVQRNFKPNTHIKAIRRWRIDTHTALQETMEFERVTAQFPLSPKGWCYLYCIQDRDAVKFGRATDPHRRRAELQVAHHGNLRLIAAIPAHSSTEALVHQRFQTCAIGGEWFRLTPEVSAFIADMQAGKNPVASLWPAELLDATRDLD